MLGGWNDWAPVPLRLVLGFGFIYHGHPKLFSAQEHRGFVGMLQGMGVPAPDIMAWIVGIVEVVGGIALIAGAFVTIAGLLLVINMLVAMFTVHMPHGFSFMNIKGMSGNELVFGMPGYEVNLLYIAGLLALILGGAGACSVDSSRRR